MATFTVPSTGIFRAANGDARQFFQNDVIDLNTAIYFQMVGAALPAVVDNSPGGLRAAIDAHTAQIAVLPNPHRGLMLNTPTRIEPIDGRYFSGGNAVTADVAYFVWFRVEQAITINAMEYLVVTAAGNVDMGIYSTTDFVTLTRLGSTGATASAGASVLQSINLTAPVALVAGTDYFAAIVGSSASLVIAKAIQFQAIGVAAKNCYQKAATDPLPASVTSLAGSTLLPFVALKGS